MLEPGEIKGDRPLPDRRELRSDLSRYLNEIPVGESRPFKVPEGIPLNKAQVTIARRCGFLWGPGSHITQVQPGREIMVWRLNEAQRQAYRAGMMLRVRERKA